MEFVTIPKDRFVNLDLEELKHLGYKIPGRVYFALDKGADPHFKLVKRIGLMDISMGGTTINDDGRMKIPNKLKLYQKACITYDSVYVHIILA